MKDFWDRRAAEDPFYFVDNRQRYGHPDEGLFWGQGERELDALLRAARVSLEASDEVVEIGCGIGRLTRALAARGGTVLALDVSPRMIELARTHGAHLGNVRWLVGDGVSLRGIGDASADGCVSHVVFQHIPDPLVTLGYVTEMGRVLRPGGWAAFQVSNDASVHRSRSASGRLWASVRAAARRGPRGQGDPAWLGSPVDLAAVGRAARAGGMEVERVVGEGTQMCCVVTRRV
jgi:SAM-dependent methyltransferase